MLPAFHGFSPSHGGQSELPPHDERDRRSDETLSLPPKSAIGVVRQAPRQAEEEAPFEGRLLFDLRVRL